LSRRLLISKRSGRELGRPRVPQGERQQQRTEQEEQPEDDKAEIEREGAKERRARWSGDESESLSAGQPKAVPRRARGAFDAISVLVAGITADWSSTITVKQRGKAGCCARTKG